MLRSFVAVLSAAATAIALVPSVSYAKTKEAENKVAPAKLPEPLTHEAIRELVSRLSDSEVRALLIQQLDRAAAPAAKSEANLVMSMESEAQRARERVDELWGALVEQFGDFAIQIRLKMKTKPNEQFVIRGALGNSGQALLEESKGGCRESVHVRHPVARSSLQGLDSLDPPSHGDACMTGGIAVSIPGRTRCTGFSDAPIGTEPIAGNPRTDQCMLFGARPYSTKELVLKVAQCMPGLARIEDDPADAICGCVGNREKRRGDESARG